jgi:hypothetical protein
LGRFNVFLSLTGDFFYGEDKPPFFELNGFDTSFVWDSVTAPPNGGWASFTRLRLYKTRRTRPREPSFTAEGAP